MPDEQQSSDAQATAPARVTFMQSWRQASPVARLLSALFALSLLSALWVTFVAATAQKTVVSEDEDAQASAAALLRKNKDGVGWVPIKGVISDSERWDRRGADNISRRIRELGERKNVKAIVLDINSPGGTVGAVQDIYATIKSVREQTGKPFIALFRDVSASGGYYVGSACDRIVAYPGTLTGSIGVIMQLTNIQGLTQKIGLRTETIKSGEFKDIGSMFRDMTLKERELLQAVVSDTYAQFYDAVKEGRKLSDAQLSTLADGRVFSGRQALSAGLIDGVGGRAQALDLASELGKLPKNPPIVNDSGDKWQELLSLLDSKLGLHIGALSKAEISGPAYLWQY